MPASFEEIIRQMMSPTPDHRPDVETLLRWPRIQQELEQRRKMAPIRYIVSEKEFYVNSMNYFVKFFFSFSQRKCCRKTKDFLWRNVCQWKDFVSNFRIVKLCTIVYTMILPSTVPSIPSIPPDDSSMGSFIDMSDTDSPIKNFSLSSTRCSDDCSMKAKIVNSTPVLRHGLRGRSSGLRWLKFLSNKQKFFFYKNILLVQSIAIHSIHRSIPAWMSRR